MRTLLKILFINLVVLVMLSACSTTHKTTQSKRSAIEQLLLSEAVLKGFPQQVEAEAFLPIPKGASIFIDISGISTDKNIISEILTGWLGQQGYVVQIDDEAAQYQLAIIVEAFGTEYADTFAGMPPLNSTILPISLPELAVFKAQYQTGYVKFYFNISELPSGRFIQSTAPIIGETFYNEYLLLFLFSFKSTNLHAPPQVGLFRQLLSSPEEAD